LTREQLIDSVAGLLEDIIDERCTRYTSLDEIPEKTNYHAKKLPSISLRDYMVRFATHSNCHENVFVMALIFLDKLGQEVADFNLDTYNVHRLLLLSMVLAIKSYDDAYYKNSYYAKIGGVTLEEFNSLEIDYLFNYIQFRLYVDPETYNSYYEDLVNYQQDKISASKEAY